MAFADDGNFFWIQSELDRKRQEGGGSARTITGTAPQPETEAALAALSRVGWRQPYLNKRLGNLTDKYLDVYQDTEIINGFGNVWYSEVGWRGTIGDTLLAMGVKNTIAAEVDRVCKPILDLPSYTYEQIIDIVLEYMAGEYDPIRPDLSMKHYYMPSLIGEWYNMPKLQCKCMNIPFISHPSIESTIITRLPSIQDHTYFFHTTNWRAVISIMEDGIDHSMGRRCLDFGTSRSFYMSDRLRTALEWGNKKYSTFKNETATLIFSIPNDTPTKHLINNEWLHVTRLSRRCKNNETKRDELMRNINKTDIVYGNIVGNPRQVKHMGAVPQPIDNMKQLASKTDRGDRLLQKYLVGCFFFSAGG